MNNLNDFFAWRVTNPDKVFPLDQVSVFPPS
jgi:hypothetical protein